MHTPPPPHTHTHVHVHTHKHTHTHKPTHTHKRTHTHTHTPNTRTYTHTQTHTASLMSEFDRIPVTGNAPIGESGFGTGYDGSQNYHDSTTSTSFPTTPLQTSAPGKSYESKFNIFLFTMPGE